MTVHPEERSSRTDGVDERGRVASAVLGGVLLLYGLRRRSVVGTMAVLVGGLLFYRSIGASGGRGSLDTSAEDVPEPHETGTTGPVEVERSITVGRPADELYEVWRDPQQLSRIVGNVGEVNVESDDRHRWAVDAPLGRSVEWETRIVEERPGELLRWESVEGARLSSEGSLRFRQAPDDRGTEVALRLRVDPPGGTLGSSVVERLGVVPETVAGEALQRFKSLAETGEIPTTEENPSARGSGDLL